MPDRVSTPARPSATAEATRGSHGSPAAATTRTAPSSPSSWRRPRVASRTTVPSGQPASGRTTFEPPARRRTGAGEASASASSPAASTVRRRRGGPPTPSVVSGARGTSDSTRMARERTSAPPSTVRQDSPGASAKTPGRDARPAPMTALLAATAGRLAPLPRRAGRLAARVHPLLWAAALLSLVVLVGGYLWFRDSGLVAVKKVDVVGASGPQAAEIRARLADAAETMTTLHVRPSSLRRAVSPYPNVRDVRVATHFPHGMTISVLSAHPAAILSGGGSQAVVSADGTVLRGSFDHAALPTIKVDAAPAGSHASGRLPLAAVSAVAAAPRPLRARLERAFWTGARGLVIQLRDGPLLIFGDAGRLEAKWMATARVLADPSSKGAAYLDVRVPERPAAGGVAPEGQGQSWGDAAAQAAAQAGAGTTSGATPGTGTATPSTTTPATPSTTTPTTG